MTHSSHNHLRAQEYKITKIPQSPLKIFKNQPIKTRQNPINPNYQKISVPDQSKSSISVDFWWSLLITSRNLSRSGYFQVSENHDQILLMLRKLRFFLNPIFLVNLYSTFPDQPSELISRLNLGKNSKNLTAVNLGSFDHFNH